MATRITIDPITRIEGHLRIDVEVQKDKIKDAWSSGTMWRGIEIILKDKHPNDAWFFTQRICGVCTTVHAIASVRAVENALKIPIPMNAQYIRNLIVLAHAMHDHIVHFYHLSALDWVDVTKVLEADPKKTAQVAQAISDWPRNSVKEFTAVKAKIKGFVEKGRLGIFANGYWGHKAMKLSPELNLLAVAHYLQALEFQQYATQAGAILSGKNPHIQNLTVGGVTTAINPDSDSALNMERLAYFKELVDRTRSFVYNVYIPDVLAIGAQYKEWLSIGGGVKNYLAVPDIPLDAYGTNFAMPGGTIVDNNVASVRPIKSFNDPYFEENVRESIAHSWYEGSWTRHPYKEDTVPEYTEHAKKYLGDKNKYSWVKSPRFKFGNQYKSMHAGPVSQVLVGFASGHPLTKKWVEAALKGLEMHTKLKLPPSILMSTLGRHAARAIRTAVMADIIDDQYNLLVNNIGKGDYEIATPVTYPKGEIQGYGFHEAPRGVLSHWVIIKDGKIKNYQCVVPSTWNAGPRDGKNQKGPYEAALVDNHPIADPEKPLEVLRTIHSFDPCLACAIHTYDPNGKEVSKVQVIEPMGQRSSC
jgi:hydrogenase large subunit